MFLLKARHFISLLIFGCCALVKGRSLAFGIFWFFFGSSLVFVVGVGLHEDLSPVRDFSFLVYILLFYFLRLSGIDGDFFFLSLVVFPSFFFPCTPRAVLFLTRQAGPVSCLDRSN